MCAIDSADDYPEFMTEYNHSAKKEHICSECRRIIYPKETYYKVVGKWDGDLRTYKHCSHCQVAAKLLQKYCGGYIFSEIRDDIHEHIGQGYEWDRDARRIYAGMRCQWKFNGELMTVPEIKTFG
jgi:hypothetical protein